MKKSELRKKVKEYFKDSKILFQPKMKDLKHGQILVTVEGRTGRVTDFDPTGKQLFNNAQRFHAVCVRFPFSNYDDCLQWSEVYCLVNNVEAAA